MPRSMAAIRSQTRYTSKAEPAHAAVLLGDEQQLDAQILAAHPFDQLGGELVALIQIDEQLLRQLVRGELPDRVERHLQHVAVQSSHGSSSGHIDRVSAAPASSDRGFGPVGGTIWRPMVVPLGGRTSLSMRDSSRSSIIRRRHLD